MYGSEIRMETNSINQSVEVIQLGLMESIKALLFIEPIFLLGIILIGIYLFWIFMKDKTIPKCKTCIVSFIMYYYLCVMLVNIVGIPTLAEYKRLLQVGETFFNPNVNTIPFSDGLNLSFILNVFLFIPLGFLCPLISKCYNRARNIFLIGLGLSFFIEIIQLFTLYRVTDINDLITNVLGTILGYFCFKLISKLQIAQHYSEDTHIKRDYTVYIPIVIMVITFLLGFFS